MPRGGVLIVLPKDNTSQRQTLLTVARLLSHEVHQVRVVPDEEVRRKPRHAQQLMEI